jgi:hypothetical protein
MVKFKFEENIHIYPLNLKKWQGSLLEALPPND